MAVMDIKPITLNGVHWPRGTSARLWFCQPRVELTTPAPFLPTHTPRSLELLQAVLDRDAQMGAPEGGAPSILLLPELSTGPCDISSVRTLISAARPNTLLICGVGHMTAAEVDAIEPSAPLCGEAVAGHFANCAVIACGGTHKLFLQPKVVASREELDCQWPGKIVRYFEGRFFSFVVFICSEMLDRAQARTTIHEVLEGVEAENRQYPIVFWLQHNPKPRSVDFSQSLEELTRIPRPTVFVVGSRKECPPRLENFAVSGALFKKSVEVVEILYHRE